MPGILVIVESPAKCKKIEGFLGAGYKCMASYGHITTLESLKDVDIKNHFKPHFKMIDSKRQNINRLEAFVRSCDEVILATDDDREGEAIAWHICQQFGLSHLHTKRIIFHEITQEAIQRAIKNPTRINMGVVHAQQARQILDIIVGFKLSPLLWSHISRKTNTGLSAGRCQTPALRVIYENQKDIDNAPGKLVYTTTGYFTNSSLPFVLNHEFTEQTDMEAFLEDSVSFDYKYSCGKTRNTTKNPPRPFTTSRIQQTANTELRCSPKETMSICQKLYESGFITYMRTDSETYCKEFIDMAHTYIETKWAEEYANRSFGEKKKKKGDNAQEAHESIRPTDIKRIEIDDQFTSKERKMYSLIWRNTVESCMTAAKYHALTASISAASDKEYRYSTEQVVFPGWKVVSGYEEENTTFAFLKTLKSIDTYKKIVSKSTLKELKQHYTEAKLVQILEENGIGRPSTFASIVEKIQERGYVKRDNIKGKTIICVDFELDGENLNEIEQSREFGNEKNKLVIQSVGIMVIEFLLAHFPTFFDYSYTKEMENQLDKIARNEMIWYKLCETCLKDIDCHPCIQERKQIHIDNEHIYMVGKYGPVIKHTVGETVTFKNVRKDIDLHKLESGEYTLEDIMLYDEPKSIGEIDGKPVIIKKGKFGFYADISGKTVSLQKLDKTVIDITVDDVKSIMKKSDVLREVSDYISLRKSKYGLYLYYKTDAHKKPEFISLKHMKNDVENCDNDVIVEYVNKYKKNNG